MRENDHLLFRRVLDGNTLLTHKMKRVKDAPSNSRDTPKAKGQQNREKAAGCCSAYFDLSLLINCLSFNLIFENSSSVAVKPSVELNVVVGANFACIMGLKN